MNTEYKIHIDEDGELSVIRLKDGKNMAEIVGAEIRPTAPKFHQFKDEFEALLAAHLAAQELSPEVTPDADAIEGESFEPSRELPTGFEFPDPALAGWKEIDGVPVTQAPPLDCDPMLGDKCPKFIAWLFIVDRAEADKRYTGKNLPTYETLIIHENGL